MLRSYYAFARHNPIIVILLCLVVFICCYMLISPTPEQKERQLREQLTQLQEALERSEAKAETLGIQLQDIQSKQVKEQEIVDQKETIAGLQNQISDLNKENGNLQDDLAKLKKKFSIQEQQLSKVTGYLQEKQGDVDELTSQNSRLHSQLDKCENKPCNQLKNSSQLTVLNCIFSYCLGYGSCCKCS